MRGGGIAAPFLVRLFVTLCLTGGTDMRITLTILLIALGLMAQSRPEVSAQREAQPYEARIIPALHIFNTDADADCSCVWDI